MITRSGFLPRIKATIHGLLTQCLISIDRLATLREAICRELVAHI